MMTAELWALVLAAGEGKRMHSSLPKVIHSLCGRPMLSYILESVAELTEQILVVVGHGASHVQAALGDKWNYVLQREQLGTGHAVMQALDSLPQEGTLLVLCGDTPLLESSYLFNLQQMHNGYAAVVATTNLPVPAGYGRIIRGQNGLIESIVEEKDASAEQKRICEINTGTYCFDLKLLRHYLPLLTTDNEQKEYYLPDVTALMRRDGHAVGAYLIEDSRVGLGINNRAQLAEAASLLRRRINNSLMLQGVSIEDPDSAYIDYDVKVGVDTVIRPGCTLEKGTIIGTGCLIGPGTHLSAALINDRVVIRQSVVEDSIIENDTHVGPFALIRHQGRK
jgi:bifunctional UDP-N-acetylglucosamine pyrophosphorylase / glucosamine-1-phosphate N-acetyltransferase